MGKLPRSWADVTIPQLMELEAIEKDTSIDKELFPAITRGIYRLGVFTKIPAEKYEEMSQKAILDEIRKIDFLKEYPKEKAVQHFYCGGYFWKVNHKVQDIKAKELIDHYELTKEPHLIMAHCHKIMALYCTPYKYFRKVKMDNIEKSNILINAPVQVIYPLTVFFCKVYPHLLNATKDYLTKITTEMEKELAQP